MPNYFGELGFLRQPGSKYSVARNGLAKYDETWLGTPSGSFTITQGAVSDRHPNCVLLEWDVSIADGCKLLIALHFEGVDDESMKDQIFDSATTTEPIDTHPRFGEIIAASGSPSDDIIDGKAVTIYPNGAVFEKASRRFLYFQTYLDNDFTDLNPKAGIKNYKAPGATFTESKIETSWPDVTALGYIDTPPAGPELETTRNWLLDKVYSRNIANVYYETRRVWLSSGLRGWDEDFYTAP
jgi:hypothetical protein